MPWSASDAQNKTKKANTPARRRQWSKIANNALSHGESEKTAIMEANGVLAREAHHAHNGVGYAKRR